MDLGLAAPTASRRSRRPAKVLVVLDQAQDQAQDARQ
jgi:hypothetical protein